MIGTCRRFAAELQAPDPARVTELEARLAKRDTRIRFVLNNPGDTEADQIESGTELRRLRKERAEDQAQLDALRAAAGRTVTVPADAEVVEMLGELAGILVAAAESSASGVAAPVRELIDRLTGGRIDLEQAGERRAQRGWLRGRFRYRLVEAVTGRLTGVEIADGESGDEVIVDYCEDPESVPVEVAGAVVAMYAADTLEKEIARQLKLPRSTVTRVLDAWDAERGVDRPDGRSRRAGLTVKHTDPPTYQALADRVKELADAEHSFGVVSEELNIDRNTLTAAWRHWHVSRCLPVPDGRARRKALRLAAANTPPAPQVEEATPGTTTDPEPPDAHSNRA